MKRLALRLDSAADKDVEAVAESERIERLRVAGAVELFTLTREFARQLNLLLVKSEVAIAPPEFGPDHFRDAGPNLIQLQTRGTILQLTFAVSAVPVSTDDFREPYILEGCVRGFNQNLLEQEAVEEFRIFLCLRKQNTEWRYFDPRTHRAGSVGLDFLASVVDRLV